MNTTDTPTYGPGTDTPEGFFSALYRAADDHEADAIEAAMLRAGMLVHCDGHADDECTWTTPVSEIGGPCGGCGRGFTR